MGVLHVCQLLLELHREDDDFYWIPLLDKFKPWLTINPLNRNLTLWRTDLITFEQVRVCWSLPLE